jgi:hypothetical protein
MNNKRLFYIFITFQRFWFIIWELLPKIYQFKSKGVEVLIKPFLSCGFIIQDNRIFIIFRIHYSWWQINGSGSKGHFLNMTKTRKCETSVILKTPRIKCGPCAFFLLTNKIPFDGHFNFKINSET